MSEQFIELKCKNCGAKLQVYGDMDRFACGYCGIELVVQRRGGTVVLRRVVAAIENVESATNRAAAELSLTRLEREVAELTERHRELLSQAPSPLVRSEAEGSHFEWVTPLGIASFIAVVAWGTSGAVLGGVMAFALFLLLMSGGLWRLFRHDSDDDHRNRSAYAEHEARLRDYSRAVADSAARTKAAEERLAAAKREVGSLV